MSGSTSDTMTSQMASPELDRRWLRGEPGAFEEAYDRYRSRLEAVACRIVGNHADAEDVVQNVFLALPRAAYRGSASLWSYLYRAAVNGSINLLRSRKRGERLHGELGAQALLPSAAAGSAPDSKLFEAEALAAVAKALLRLRPEYRRVLVLRVNHGLSNREIAEREGVPVATVATWMRRGREQLRQALRPILNEAALRPGRAKAPARVESPPLREGFSGRSAAVSSQAWAAARPSRCARASARGPHS